MRDRTRTSATTAATPNSAAVTEAAGLVKRSSKDGWRLAELTATELDRGVPTRAWAEAISLGVGATLRYALVWRRYGHDSERAFADVWVLAGRSEDAAAGLEEAAEITGLSLSHLHTIGGRERAHLVRAALGEDDLEVIVREAPPAMLGEVLAERAEQEAEQEAGGLAGPARRAAFDAAERARQAGNRYVERGTRHAIEDLREAVGDDPDGQAGADRIADHGRKGPVDAILHEVSQTAYRLGRLARQAEQVVPTMTADERAEFLRLTDAMASPVTWLAIIANGGTLDLDAGFAAMVAEADGEVTP